MKNLILFFVALLLISCDSRTSQSQPMSKYLEIKNVVKNYALVYNDSSTPMKMGESFMILRFDNDSNQKFLGFAKVIKISGNKIALELDMLNGIKPKAGDMIEYSKDRYIL